MLTHGRPVVAGKNGQLVGECEGVDVDVFPSVTLAGPGDEVTIATPVLFLPGPLEACPTDPLPELFQSGWSCFPVFCFLRCFFPPRFPRRFTE